VYIVSTSRQAEAQGSDGPPEGELFLKKKTLRGFKPRSRRDICREMCPVRCETTKCKTQKNGHPSQVRGNYSGGIRERSGSGELSTANWALEGKLDELNNKE